MNGKTLKIYVDTSVFGGCHDAEFFRESMAFFHEIKKRKGQLYISEIVLRELAKAPLSVRNILNEFPRNQLNLIEIDQEVVELRNYYLKAGVVSKKWVDDATHVAAATVARVDAIVSWNFRHIVKLDKMKRYNLENIIHGYGVMTIISPREVLGE